KSRLRHLHVGLYGNTKRRRCLTPRPCQSHAMDDDRLSRGRRRHRALSHANHFDASVHEIFLPLLSGAALCVAPSLLNPTRFSAYLKQGIMAATFVPSLLGAISAVRTSDAGCNLKRIFSGGEALAAGVAREVMSAWKVPLVNLYGPTEATIQVT